MFVYYGKRFDSARIGGSFVRVACDKCGCEYFYELTRIGKGRGTAPYGIGQSRATLAAEQQSERDLRERLALEAELVPCPECNWINEDLVAGYPDADAIAASAPRRLELRRSALRAR